MSDDVKVIPIPVIHRDQSLGQSVYGDPSTCQTAGTAAPHADATQAWQGPPDTTSVNHPDIFVEGPSRHAIIQMAVLAALMHVKPDYRSPRRLDECASTIADFVEGALKDAVTAAR